MKWRRFLILGGVLCAIARIVYGIIAFDPEAPKSDWPVLQAASPSLAPRTIAVGTNVCVSAGQPGRFEYCTIAANPNEPSRLFAACLQHASKSLNLVGFYSSDGGTTWQLGCERVRGGWRSDVSVSFAADRVYLVCMRGDSKARPPLGTDDALRELEFLASLDGGKTWEERAVISKYIDRPWIIADTSAGAARGRLYCVGNVDELIVLRSSDEGRTFGPPLTPVGHRLVNCRVANPALTSSGTLMLVCQDRFRGVATLLGRPSRATNWPRPRFLVFRSRDGGESFAECTRVNTKWRHDSIPSDCGGETYFPQLAADPGSARFAGRVYCVWADGSRGERIFFSSSPDEGDSWTDAIVLSEQPMTLVAASDYISFMPCIAVNRQGVIAVTWYDRRGLPPGRLVPMDGAPQGVFRTESPGWNVRMRASLDGGATWLPSVQLNEKPAQGQLNVGHAAGLAASRDGRFHAAWIDNRSGRCELWTASVATQGTQ